MADYVYGFASILGTLLFAVGGLVVTFSANRLRHGRAWIMASLLPFLAVPITFGIVCEDAILGIAVATFSSFLLGMVYYGIWCAMSEQIQNADQRTQYPSEGDVNKRA